MTHKKARIGFQDQKKRLDKTRAKKKKEYKEQKAILREKGVRFAAHVAKWGYTKWEDEEPVSIATQTESEPKRLSDSAAQTSAESDSEPPELTPLEPEAGQLQIVEADPENATKKPAPKKKSGIPKTPIEIAGAIKAGYYKNRIQAPPAAKLDESESFESGQLRLEHR